MSIQDAILYALMTFGPSCWYEHGARLSAQHFDGDRREVFEVIRKLNHAGEESNLVTVSENAGDYARELVAEIFRNTSATSGIMPSSVRSLVRHLRTAHETKTAQDIGALLAESGDKETAIAALMAMESESHNATIGGADAEKILTDSLENHTEGLKTGLVDVDAILGGIEPADLCIIAARPGMGKTACLLNILDAQECGVLMFSLEMSTAQLMKRRLAAKGFDYRKLRNPRSLPDYERNRIKQALPSLKQNFCINDTAAMPIGDIESESHRMTRTRNIGLIAVDYLQLITCSAENRLEEVSEISRRLKKIAKRCQIPVIALCQLNRAVEHRGTGAPKLSDLRESGQIEQDADQVIFIDRPEVNVKGIRPGEADIHIAKNRSGESGVATVCWQGVYQRFVDMARDQRAAAI